MTTAFVAGATGYTGRNMVRCLVKENVRTVAHVRPDSPSLHRWRAVFQGQGAVVDNAPWTAEGVAQALAEYRPRWVFALLGTTAKRGRRDGGTYETVDYGLTSLLLHAAAGLEPRPTFVYLSSAGAGGRAFGSYMKARVRIEAEIRALDMPHLIARPAFITGDDRGEARPLERLGARVVDEALGGLAAVGVSGPRDRWASMTGPELAAGLARLVTSGRTGVVEAAELRAV